MKVSVIIPCYNFEDYIEQSILSAVSQKTNFEFEILVRDDMSSDNSQVCIERVANFNSNVKYFKPEENWGFKNIKFLMEQCKGEYIAWLDGDDYWTDIHKLQKQVDFLDQNPEYVMTFTGHWTKDKNGNYSPSLPYQWLCLPNNFNDEVKTEDLLTGNWVSFGKLFRNSQNIIEDWMGETLYLDWSMNYKLSKNGKIKYLDFPSGVYRIHNNGAFSSMNYEKKEEISRGLMKVFADDYNNYKNYKKLDIIDFIKEIKPSLILEIGAHFGTETHKFKEVAPNCEIISFEPDPRNVKILKERGIDKICKLEEFAISNINGKIKFYLSSGDCSHWSEDPLLTKNDWSASSSLKSPKLHLDQHKWVKFEEIVEVNSIRLDDYEYINDRLIDFIWMDVQGAEDLVFQGSTETLKRTKYLYTEYNNQELYEGQLNLEQIKEILGSDWELVYLYNDDVLMKNKRFNNESSC
jgi:FkbM family methyltransferase